MPCYSLLDELTSLVFVSTTLQIYFTIGCNRLYNFILKLYYNALIGKTETFHEMPIQPETGIHYITVEDGYENDIKRKIEIIQDLF